MRRALILWTVGFALLIGAFATTVAILDATLYSAHGFVASYLGALARHDATTARQLPGVRAPEGVSTALLTDDALGSITRIRLVSDTADSHGIHTVQYRYTLGKRSATTTFRIAPAASYLGIFDRWSFSTSPLATVSVTVLHDQRFRANGTAQLSTAKRDTAESYEVFAPGLYTFDHRSQYLAASAVAAVISEPGSITPVQVDVQANRTLVADVDTQLTKYLAACATQKVLLPTSCPFGKSFDNRVVSTPEWRMLDYPKVTIVPDGNTGNWLVPATRAVAHLKVDVQSLFNGKVSTFDDDVAFPVSFTIVIGANNSLAITSIDG